MSDIEKIRQKIENSIKAFEFNGGIYDSYEAGELSAYKEILDFIDSLPDEQFTWQDIKRIVNIADALLDDPKARIAIQNHSEEEYYQKVLDEYNKDVSKGITQLK